jgi:FkbM family methyltransferase
MNSQAVTEIIQFFNRGGFFMYLLAACSVVGVAVILLRMLGLRHDLAIPNTIRQEIERMQADTENPTGRLAAFLMGDRSPLGRVIRVALKHLDVFPGVRFERTIKVRTMRLDTFAREQKLGPVDLIWADVQGAEADLIAGGTEVLARTRLLFTEYNEVEMYEGQVGLRRLLELLPDFEVFARWPTDALLRNRSLHPGAPRG